MDITQCFYRAIDKKMKNKIIDIIKDSFEQNNERKTVYVSNQLKKIYPKEDWTVIYVYQGNDDDISYHPTGSIFACKYKDRRIIVFQSRIIQKSPTYNEKEIEEEEEKEEEDYKEIISSNKKLSEMQSKLEKAEKLIKEYKLKINELNSKLELSQKSNSNIQNNKGNDSFNQTFYKRDQMIALNFISSDQQ